VKRVTADSNVLISAILRGGKPRDLLNLVHSGQIDLALSEDNLDRKPPGAPRQAPAHARAA
jgi:predicted nucleic acid-binding protein